MKPKLQAQLFSKYPEIFRDRTRSMRETCMCWGICTGDGWYDLLDRLCGDLQWNTDKNSYPQVVADQVKEKFGTLRFYYHLEDTNSSREKIFRKLYFYSPFPQGWSLRKCFNKENAKYTFRNIAYTPRNWFYDIKRHVQNWWNCEELQWKSRKDGHIDGAITLACSMSAYICEECGKPGQCCQQGGHAFGWVKTVCDKCGKKLDFYPAKKKKGKK